MERQTRIGEVRSIAKALLYIDIAPTRLSYIASHPFTNTWDTALPREENGKTLIEFVDLREAEGQRQWREALESRIEEASLNRLPDTVTVYRGVTKVNHTRQKAVSWTVDYETAVWFANRYRDYETESGIHEVWTVTVPKERILASFTEDGKDNEGEVIVNLYGEKFEIRREAV